MATSGSKRRLTIFQPLQQWGTDRRQQTTTTKESGEMSGDNTPPKFHSPSPWQYHPSGMMVMTGDGQTTVLDVRGYGPLSTKYGQAKAAEIMDATGRLAAQSLQMFDAIQKFLDVWERSGPNGSHQFEKFDGIIRDFRIIVDSINQE